MTTWELHPTPPELEARWLADGWWDDRSLGQFLDEGLTAHPDLACQVHSTVRPWQGTFAELQREALAVAGGLRARGIGPGDPVAFQLPNWHEAVTSFWAAAFLGAVVVPIVHSYGPKEVAFIIRRTGVKAFITGTSFGAIDFLATLDQIRPEIDGVEVIAVVDLDPERDGERPGVISFAELAGERAARRADPGGPVVAGAHRLHLGHDRRAQGRHPHPPHHRRRDPPAGRHQGRGRPPAARGPPRGPRHGDARCAPDAHPPGRADPPARPVGPEPDPRPHARARPLVRFGGDVLPAQPARPPGPHRRAPRAHALHRARGCRGPGRGGRSGHPGRPVDRAHVRVHRAPVDHRRPPQRPAGQAQRHRRPPAERRRDPPARPRRRRRCPPASPARS